MQRREETGIIGTDTETNKEFLETVFGFYEYIRPDGKIQKVEYTAGVGGFRPKVTVIDAGFGQGPATFIANIHASSQK